MSQRKEKSQPNYDLLILGGGITGATLYQVSKNSGKKTLLVDHKDFASGTSQASGMMIWGGLLYLKNLEFTLVRKFCKARDFLINHSKQVYVRRFHFALLKEEGRSAFIVRAGLAVYRLLSFFHRGAAKVFSNLKLPEEWNVNRFKGGVSYEEAFLKTSDAQFTQQWIFRDDKASDSQALNYVNVKDIEWNPNDQHFEVRFTTYENQEKIIFANQIVNACGVWADSVNEQFGFTTKHCHHLSQGVYLLLKNNQENNHAFVVDMQEHDDTLCWVPWGPTIMWGPTETTIKTLDEFKVTSDDIDFLLKKLNSNTSKTFSREDILNVRVGVRPLAKTPDQVVNYSLDLSRKAILEADSSLPWHTIFGGKLSGGLDFSFEVFKKIFNIKASLVEIDSDLIAPRMNRYFNKTDLPDVKWCVEHTQVRCIEDYLRRRTNVAQWIPNGGLGFQDEYLSDIKEISLLIHADANNAKADVQNYRDKQIKEREGWNN